MPLDTVARRYADNLFTQDMERLSLEYQTDSAGVSADFGKRNMLQSGMYFGALAQAGIRYLGALARARADSLVKAFDRAGLRIDDDAVTGIHTEVASYCESQGTNLAKNLEATVRQASMPDGVASSISETIAREVSRITNGIRLKLSERRDEDILAARAARAAARDQSVAESLIFLSHAAADQHIATALKEAIEKGIPGADVFVSSDGEDLHPGDPWVETILTKLEQASLLIVLATARGMMRRWVWYEAGAGWSRGLRVIPCCLGKSRKGQLMPPFSGYQALNVDEGEDLRSLLATLETDLKLTGGKVDLAAIAAKVRELDERASIVSDSAEKAVEIARPSEFEVALLDTVQNKLKPSSTTERDLLRFFLQRGETVGQMIYRACQVGDAVCTGALERLTHDGLLLTRTDMSHPLLEQPRYWKINPSFEAVLRNLLFPRNEVKTTPDFNA